MRHHLGRRSATYIGAAALAAGVLSGIGPLASPAGAAASCSGTTTVTCTFFYTGSVHNFIVPSGDTQLTITTVGAGGGGGSGGGSSAGQAGGNGASETGTFAVSGGQTLHLIVGQGGGLGQEPFTGAGGGGGSFVFDNSNNVMIAAGGGGGGGYQSTGSDATFTTTAGSGGGTNGGAGGNNGAGGAGGSGTIPQSDNGGGGGGTTSSGGTGAGFGGGGGGQNTATGGAGGFARGSGGRGGFGGGGGGVGQSGGAGGGGGYSGGGGGDNFYGGGGGASFNTGTSPSHGTGAGGGSGGISSGGPGANGEVTITGQAAAPTLPTGASHTWTTGSFDSLTIDGSGLAVPSIVHPYGQAGDGKLPNSLSLTDNGDGSATISGTPAANAGGTYVIKLVGTNSSGSDTKTVTVVVQQPPVMSLPPNGGTVGFKAGVASSVPWSVTAPATTWSHINQPVTYTTTNFPAALNFNNNGNGTGTLSGTLAKGTYGPMSIEAQNVAGSSTTTFFIKVS